MKKHRVINQYVSEAIAGMGHTDTFVICDAGFPIPTHSNKIDISLVFNVPTGAISITESGYELIKASVAVSVFSFLSSRMKGEVRN